MNNSKFIRQDTPSIVNLPEKTSPVGADTLLIEDSENSNVSKKIIFSKVIPTPGVFPIVDSGSWGGNQSGFMNWGRFTASEASVEVVVPSITITSLRIRVYTLGNSNATFTLRKNGADTGITLTVTAGAAGSYLATGIVIYSAGDRLSLSVAIAAGGGIGIASGEFEYKA